MRVAKFARVVFFITAAILCCLQSVRADDATLLTIENQRGTEATKLTIDGETCTIDVQSPCGIGRLELVRKGQSWPKRLVLHLHLAGLEGLTLANEQFTAQTFFTNQGSAEVQTADGHDETPKPECTIPIQRLSEKLIEVEIPATIATRQSARIQIRWIDFYR